MKDQLDEQVFVMSQNLGVPGGKLRAGEPPPFLQIADRRTPDPCSSGQFGLADVFAVTNGTGGGQKQGATGGRPRLDRSRQTVIMEGSGSSKGRRWRREETWLRRHRKINDPVAAAWAGALAAFVLGKILEIARLLLRVYPRARSRLHSVGAPGLVTILQCLLGSRVWTILSSSNLREAR